MKDGLTAHGDVTVPCPCGERPLIRIKRFGRTQTCGACGALFKVEPGKPPRIVFLQLPPPKPKSAAPVGAAICACGTALRVSAEHAGRDVKCPVCGRVSRFEKVRDPQTMTTTIRRIDASEAARPPNRPPSGPLAQPLLCSCGEQLFVSHEDLGKQAQCPSCGILMHLEKSRDPQTMDTVVRARVVGRAPAKPKPPEPKSGLEDWSMDDFR